MTDYETDAPGQSLTFGEGESGKLCTTDAETVCEVTNEAPVAGGDQHTAALADFGVARFSGPGTYMVKVEEVVPENTGDIDYDTHVLYVLYVIGSDGMHRYIRSTQAGADQPSTADPEADGSGWTKAGDVPYGTHEPPAITDDSLTWTNTLVVANLPLTGGDATARNVVLAGGGVLLLAGAAWLLARRRRV